MGHLFKYVATPGTCLVEIGGGNSLVLNKWLYIQVLWIGSFCGLYSVSLTYVYLMTLFWEWIFKDHSLYWMVVCKWPGNSVVCLLVSEGCFVYAPLEVKGTSRPNWFGFIGSSHKTSLSTILALWGSWGSICCAEMEFKAHDAGYLVHLFSVFCCPCYS